jgi:hypothetical protein
VEFRLGGLFEKITVNADQSMPSEAELVSAGVDLIAASTPCFLPARRSALYLTVDPEMMG